MKFIDYKEKKFEEKPEVKKEYNLLERYFAEVKNALNKNKKELKS